jgi:hypothetical protein
LVSAPAEPGDAPYKRVTEGESSMRRFIMALGLAAGLLGVMGNTAAAEEIPSDEIPCEKVSDSPHCWTVWVCDAWDSRGHCTHGHDEKHCE